MSLIERMRAKNQPAPLLPEQRPVSRHPRTAEMLDEWNADLDALSYFKSRCEELENEDRRKSDRIGDLEAELAYVRDDRDRLFQAHATGLATIDDILALIIARKTKSRAEPYAPPGTGHQDGPERPMTQAEQEGLKVVAETLAPITQGNEQ